MPRYNVSIPVVHSFLIDAADPEAAMEQAEDMVEAGNFSDDYAISGTAASEVDDNDEVDDGESELDR